MNKRLMTCLALACVGLLVTGLYFWWTADSHRIRRLMGDLESSLQIKGGEAELTRLAQAKRVSGYFAKEIHLQPWPGEGAVQSKDLLLSLLVHLFREAQALEVTFSAVEVLVGEEGRSATVTLEAQATLQLRAQGDSQSGRYLIKLLKDEEDTWLISELEPIAVSRNTPTVQY